ncbi:MAG: hypothetical protein IPH06_10850 [Alphaproteobacteria bacterium]|nr:hypothetical protein [Alphaproteobacteria bacterium]QQS58480.1 MAG: hypothetical protein IPN28_06605 [Alphaproteobacteria bacterium]
MKRLIILLASSIFLSGCNPFDPLLLETTLPNGYVFSSNGGYEGYIYSNDPSKDEKIGDYFKIFSVNPEDVYGDHEAWCYEFAWEGEYVICRYVRTNLKTGKGWEGYFVLNTITTDVKLMKKFEAQYFWQKKFKKPLPEMYNRYFWYTKKV